MDSSLQLLKAGRLSLGVERDDLAVEDERRSQRPPPLFQRRDDLRKLLRLLVAEPRPQTHRAANLRDRANAVVLGFVDELRIVERRVGERREHGREHFRFQNSDFRLKELRK